MKFSLLVLGSPWSGQSGDSAWRFARALLDEGHELYRVFFYLDAVHAGSQLAVAPQGQTDPVARWAELASGSGAELALCVASAVKRGMLDNAEAERHERGAANVHPAFTLAGLGQLVDANIHSDRLVTFGG